MNKLLAIPMLFIIFLGIIGMTYNPNFHPSGNVDIGTGNNQSLSTSEGDGYVDIPGGGSQYFDLSGAQGALVVITAAIALGIASGVSILGSGLSDGARKLIFLACAYFGIWGIFSALALKIINSMDLFGPILWIILTIMYAVGFTQSANTNAVDEA